MKKLWKLFLWELELKIKFDPYNGVYDVKLGWIWVIYFGVKLLAGFLHLITDLIKWL
jgi:hypothetical protein